MAGAGYKLFNTGDVLTAQQVNEYLMQQTVMVFADASARTTALSGVLAEGMLSYLKSDDKTYAYNGTSWVQVGGSSPLTTKGDLYTYSTADARLASSGVNGDILTVDTSTATGLKWATPSSSSALTFISRTSFTSAASVTIDNLFSDTYEHYLVRMKVVNVTSSENPRLQARYGSTTETGSQYWSGGVIRDGGGAGNVGFDVQGTYWQLDNPLSTNEASTYSLNFWRGSGNGKLIYDGSIFSRSYAGGGALAGWCNADRTWTGLYLFPAANTISGTVTVYGMAKS